MLPLLNKQHSPCLADSKCNMQQDHESHTCAALLHSPLAVAMRDRERIWGLTQPSILSSISDCPATSTLMSRKIWCRSSRLRSSSAISLLRCSIWLTISRVACNRATLIQLAEKSAVVADQV